MDHKYAKLFAAAATVALAATSFGTAALAQDGGHVIGVTNTVQGNGWREEMICSIWEASTWGAALASADCIPRTPPPPAIAAPTIRSAHTGTATRRCDHAA